MKSPFNGGTEKTAVGMHDSSDVHSVTFWQSPALLAFHVLWRYLSGFCSVLMDRGLVELRDKVSVCSGACGGTAERTRKIPHQQLSGS